MGKTFQPEQVTMAFVIDTSSSMKDDMTNVRKYIQELILEQQKAGVKAEFIVTTFADNPGMSMQWSSVVSILSYSVNKDC